MAKETVKQNSTKQTPSTPSKGRAKGRAKANKRTVAESGAIRDEAHEAAAPVIEITPSRPPGLGRVVSHTARRMQSARIVGGEPPDACVVDLMTNFLVDHRSDTGAERIPCGEVTGIDGITEEIQARFVPKYGAGYYRMTPRVNGKITKGQWVEYISAPAYVESDLGSDEFDDDGNEESSSDDPEVIKLHERNKYLTLQIRDLQGRNGNGYDPVFGEVVKQIVVDRLNPPDPLEEMERYERMRNMFAGRRESNSTPAPVPQPAVDPKVAALELIAKNPTLTGVIKEVFGVKTESDSDPWADVASKLIDSGQLTPLVQAGASILGNIFSTLLPKPPQTPAQQPPQAPTAQAPQQAPQQPTPQVAQAQAQALPEGNRQPQAPPEQAQMLSPEEQALQILITHCAQNLPAQVACGRLLAFAEAINEQAPAYSIDAYIDMFAAMPTDAALGFVKSRPGGAEVAAMPHARAWCEQLQKFLKESADGDDEFDEFTEINQGEVKL